jgi:hypothetical protein
MESQPKTSFGALQAIESLRSQGIIKSNLSPFQLLLSGDWVDQIKTENKEHDNWDEVFEHWKSMGLNPDDFGVEIKK